MAIFSLLTETESIQISAHYIKDCDTGDTVCLTILFPYDTLSPQYIVPAIPSPDDIMSPRYFAQAILCPRDTLCPFTFAIPCPAPKENKPH
jgi:hypothetical protein